jgi:hypothetical protein
MRPVRLAQIAAEAEGVRWRAFGSRIVARLVCAIVALVFLIGALAVAHIAAWYWLRIDMGLAFYWAALAVGGFDLVVAFTLLMLANRSGPSRTEREALEVRQRAIAGLMSTMSMAQLVLPALRIAYSMSRRGSGRTTPATRRSTSPVD